MPSLDRDATSSTASKAADHAIQSNNSNEASAISENSVIRDDGGTGKVHNEEYNESSMNVSDELLAVGDFVGNERQGQQNESRNNHAGNGEDEDNVEDIGKFSIDSISTIANIDHISIDQMNGMDNIDNIDGIEISHLNGQNIISEQQDFPTIEVIKNVQRNRKKRQFSTIEDEEMSRLEFQQWTSGFLADDLEDSNVDVSIDDVEYGFPQTTAAHFTDVVDEQSNTGSTNATGKKRRVEKRGQGKGQRFKEDHIDKAKSTIGDQKDNIGKSLTSLYIKHEQEADVEVSNKEKINVQSRESPKKIDHIHKVADETKTDHRHLGDEMTEKEDDNVDPELANIDTNSFVHDAMLDARALVSLHTLDYLRNRNEGANDERVNEDDDENLAVEAVNRAVNQAVAAVHASGSGRGDEDVEHEHNNVGENVNVQDNDNNNEADTDVIAAAVVAAENSVRKQIQNAGLVSHDPERDKQLFDLFQKEHEKHVGTGNVGAIDDVDGIKSTNAPLVTQHGIKNNKVLSKLGGTNGTKKNTKKKAKEVKIEESKESLLEKEMISDAILKAQKLISDQPKGRSFTKEEADAIEVFIKEYEKIHGMTHEQFLQRIWGNERKKDKFWEILHSVLPNRTRSSLYKHVRRTYHIFEKRGVWSSEEDLKLAELAKTCEGKWRLIGEKLKRMPEDCRDRWRNYVKCGAQRNVNQWTIQEEFKLKSIVARVLQEERQKMRENMLQIKAGSEAGAGANSKDHGKGTSKQESRLKQAREAQVSPTINWTTISELMGGTRSRIQCRYKWKKIMKNESVKKLREMNHDTKLWMLRSIKKLSENDPNIEANLDWNALALSIPDDYNIAVSATCMSGAENADITANPKKSKLHESNAAMKEEESDTPMSVTWNGVDLSTCFQRLKGTVDANGKSFVETVDLLIDALSASSYVDRLVSADADTGAPIDASMPPQ